MTLDPRLADLASRGLLTTASRLPKTSGARLVRRRQRVTASDSPGNSTSRSTFGRVIELDPVGAGVDDVADTDRVADAPGVADADDVVAVEPGLAAAASASASSAAFVPPWWQALDAAVASSPSVHTPRKLGWRIEPIGRRERGAPRRVAGPHDADLLDDVAPVPYVDGAGGTCRGRRLGRWGEAWNEHELRQALDVDLGARDRRLMGLHEAACALMYQGDRSGAHRMRALALGLLLEGCDEVDLDGQRVPIAHRRAGVALVARDEGYAFVLTLGACGVAVDEGERLCQLAARDGFALLRRQVLGGEALWVVRVAASISSLVAPATSRVQQSLRPEEVVAHVEALRRAGVEARVDPGLAVAASAAAGRVELRLAEHGGDLCVCVRVNALGDGVAWVPGVGEAEALGVRDGVLVRTARDLASEHRAACAVSAELGLPAAAHLPFTWRIGCRDSALDLLERIKGLGEQLAVRWDTAPPVVKRPLPDLSLRVSLGVGWTDSRVDVAGEQVPLRVLLESLRGGRRHIEVRDGVFIRVEAQLRRRLGRVGQLVAALALDDDDPLDAELRDADGLSPGLIARRAALVAALGEAGTSVDGGEALSAAAARHRASLALEPSAPDGLRATLRPYQFEGFRFLSRLAEWTSGGLLADDMGLGKTVQALAFLLRRAALGGAMVVAPASVLEVWRREAAVFAPELRVVAMKPATLLAAGGGAIASPGAGTVWLLSWSQLVRHASPLADCRFATVVYDEAQMAKNADTARNAAARGLRAGFSLLLSGTPIENRTMELWSLMSIAVPGLLGGRRAFFARFASPIEADGDDAAAAALGALVAPFVLRRRKEEVLRELPPRQEIDVPVVLSPPERRHYELARAAVHKALRSRDPDERKLVFAGLTRLRQLACNPRLCDPGSTLPSAKLERARRLLRELRSEGRRALVFSQFTSHLDACAEAFEAEGLRLLRIDGRVSRGRRAKVVDAFQRGEGDALLISLGAGGTGLTLTAADAVVLLDPWWNPAAEAQAADRAHRIGQTRPVSVFRLISVDTVEARVRDLQRRKAAIANDVLAGVAGAGSGLSAEALEALVAAEVDLDAVDVD